METVLRELACVAAAEFEALLSLCPRLHPVQAVRQSSRSGGRLSSVATGMAPAMEYTVELHQRCLLMSSNTVAQNLQTSLQPAQRHALRF